MIWTENGNNIWRTQPPIIVPLSTKDIGKKYSDLSVCVKDGRQLKDILFTTKAMGVGNRIERSGREAYFYRPMESSGNSSVARTQALPGCR